VTVQVLAAKGPAQDVVWDEVRGKARVEAGWADRLQQDRAEIVSARTAEQRLLILLDNLAMRRVVLSVEQK
jgi:hypothetical protein